MTVVYIISGILLTVLFFLNIKNAAEFLCRIIGGFFFLYIYNTVAPMLTLPLLGINVISATVSGLLGLPGSLLLLCLVFFL